MRSVRGVERAGCVAGGCLHIQGSRAAADEAEEACGVVLGRYHILVTVTDPPPGGVGILDHTAACPASPVASSMSTRHRWDPHDGPSAPVPEAVPGWPMQSCHPANQ